MSTNTKIYTASEVASAGFSKEEINQALVAITQEAYEAAQDERIQVCHNSTDPNFLNDVAHRLRELGYTTEIFEKSFGNHWLIVQWDNAHPDKETE